MVEMVEMVGHGACSHRLRAFVWSQVETESWGFPWWPSGKDSMLSVQESWV